MSARRVVVVGAGALGLSCAAHLTDLDPDLDVTVLDREFPASGSSGLSVGIFTRQYMSRRDIELRIRSVEELSRLEASAGLDLARIGFVRLARDPETLAQFEASAAIQRELGVHDTRVIDADELRTLQPRFRADGVAGALYSPSEGYLDGSQLCNLYAEQATARGATLMVRTELLGMGPGSDAKYALDTSKGTVAADVVVNAAGAWGEIVGRRLDAPLRVVNERHEAYVFGLPRSLGYVVPMTLDYVPGRSGSALGLFFRQEGEHQLIAGLHSNDIVGDPVEDPDGYFRGVHQDHAETVIEMLIDAMPEVDGIAYQGGWSGLYPHSPDQELVIGPHPDNPDVIVGAGLGGIGLSMAPVLGDLLAEWVVHGGTPSFPTATDFLPRPHVAAP